jgi:hypothetical protein
VKVFLFEAKKMVEKRRTNFVGFFDCKKCKFLVLRKLRVFFGARKR